MDNYMERLERGAEIIIEDWIQIQEGENLLIVTSENYMTEASKMEKYALEKNANVDIMKVKKAGIHVGVYFDENEKVFDDYDIIIGATDYSLITTKATKRATSRGSKFLSLPLSVSSEESMLSYDFIRMDTEKSRLMANQIIGYIRDADVLHVTTEMGTDIKFYKENREPGFFNGVADDSGGYTSSSFEIYVPIEETKTEGIMVVDGSMGYIGVPKDPIRLEFKEGRIIEIEDNESGKVLKDYIKDYEDENMYIASEFGIGLNTYSKPRGLSYIEDESAYGTFHVGFGRNIALGGDQEASGHFDLVSMKPDIYAGDVKIMENGEIIKDIK